MRMLLHNKLCPFNFDDWQAKKIRKIYAGNSCIMAIDADGAVFQKVLDENLAARTKYWNNIKSIAISQCFPSLALGLVNDGTCMVSKRALRHCCSITKRNFDAINEQIKSLKEIVELVVSDAVFALDRFGTVHHIPLWKEDTYTEVSTWRNICHIAVGNQDSVFGITESGSIVCAGGNLSNGPHNNIKDTLANIENVIDVCALGSECEKIMIALFDGSVVDYNGNAFNIQHSGQWPVFYNNCNIAAISSKGKHIKCEEYYHCICEDDIRRIEKKVVSDIAIGMNEKFSPFIVWIE